MSKIMELADAYAAADAEEHYEMNFGDQKQFNKATYNKSQARAALAAEVEKLEKELNTLDVMLEECKMDWSGDVTQLKAEHKHEVDALREKLAAVEKDAARYRWLRERDDWVLMPGMRSEVCLRSNLDDQIDMSMGAFIGATK